MCACVLWVPASQVGRSARNCWIGGFMVLPMSAGRTPRNFHNLCHMEWDRAWTRGRCDVAGIDWRVTSSIRPSMRTLSRVIGVLLAIFIYFSVTCMYGGLLGVAWVTFVTACLFLFFCFFCSYLFNDIL